MQNVGVTVQGAMAQPPFIRFETRAVERRKTVEEGGAVYYEDVDFAIVTPFGSKDTTEKVVKEWFSRLVIEVRDSRLPQNWLDAFKGAYEAWKNDQDPPVIGTDIKQWPAASPAEVKMLLGLHCTSVEALAGANEEFLMRYGMGGRALKQKAEAWLAAQKDHGPIVARIAALESATEGLKGQIETWKGRAQAAELALQSVQAMQQPAIQWTPIAQVAAPPKDDTDALIADGVEAGFSATEA